MVENSPSKQALHKVENLTTSADETLAVLSLVVDALETEAVYVESQGEENIGYSLAKNINAISLPVLRRLQGDVKAAATGLREVERMLLA